MKSRQIDEASIKEKNSTVHLTSDKKYPFRTPIPPRSTVRVKDVPRSPWRKELGKVFQIGYYSKMDGLDCLWLLDEQGDTARTLDLASLHKFFENVSIWNERSHYGRNRRSLEPLT